MASLEELRNVRLEKLEKLRDLGMNPFPKEVTRTKIISGLIEDFKEGDEYELAGRIMAIRGSGAISFVVINDGTGEFQAVLKKDEIDESSMTAFADTVDVGDFIWFKGETFVTKRGAQSLLVKEWKMAGKSLLPLPDKHSGLQDQEEIYRKRYLETLTNKDAFDRFAIRSKIISAIRAYFDKRDFMEVETPILQNQAGGAMAQTFNTYHNDLGMDMVLRIALELEHKMIVAGGYPRIYEIGKNFRNEGSDPTHIQEFTMIEWYAAYQTLDQNMIWTEELLTHLAEDIVGKTVFVVQDKDGNDQEVDFKGPWPRVRFDDLLKENANLDIQTASLEEVKEKAVEYGISKDDLNTTGKANLLDYIYKKTSRNKIINPTFVTNYPGDLKPLAQQNEDGTAQVAQLIIAGAEITNQYTELVDPLKQRELLEKQSQAKDAGDQEAMQVDERFLVAMEHGMPPMTGFGMGIDRLVALLTEQTNLRDIIFFPIMKEKGSSKKEKTTKVAVAILNKESDLQQWQEMNTIAHLGVELGVHEGKKLLMFDSVRTKDDKDISLNIKHAILVKKADSLREIKDLVISARALGLDVSEFTREMLETTNDKKIKEITAAKLFSEVEHLGVLIFGDKKEVERLTSSFELA